jgi:hypothetical protein
MFFNISPTIDRRFPYNFSCNFATFNCDAGWHKVNINDTIIFAKGYCDSCEITDLLNNFDGAGEHSGNFCLVRFSDKIEIVHNKNRGFPLRFSQNSVTNLFSDAHYQSVWADNLVQIDNKWKITTSKINLDTVISSECLSIADAANKIFDLLVTNIDEFGRNIQQAGLKLFCSGGLDTLLLYSLLTYTNTKFDLLTTNHFEIDDFITTNKLELENNWAYKQVHHWQKPSCLATGGCGDEYFLRGPAVISMITAWNNIEFHELLRKSVGSYHYKYFSKYDIWQTDWNRRELLQKQYPTRESLYQQILNVLLNDHQHWHIGNTLTYTPFKNIEITKILLQCTVEDLVPQFLDGNFTKTLISKVDPALLNSLSKYKNFNSAENISLLIDHNLNEN